MRQTRRSRSSAATPQKDESTTQVEDVKVDEKSVKTNLETVFEKEVEVKEEIDSAGVKVDDVPVANSVPASEENEKLVDETESEQPASEASAIEPSASEELATELPAAVEAATEETASEEPTESAKSDESLKAETSPKKPDSGVIELNCQVCNCSFTNYHVHMNSDSHKSKISALKTENQNNADKIGTPGQAQKRSGDQDAAPTPKRLKNQSAPNTPNTPNAQNAPDKFYCDICKLSILKQQDFDHHMNGKRHMLNVTRAQGKSYCEICKLFFNSITDLNDHNESQMHKKNVAERKQDKQVFECKLCAVTSCGQRQYDQHLTSKRHKRLLANPPSAVKPTTTTATTPVNGKAETKTNDSEKKWLYMCNACNFGSNQDQQFSSHMNLAEHKAAAIDLKKKGLVQEKDVKPALKTAVKPASATNASQNARKFTPGNAGARNIVASAGVNQPQNKANVKPNSTGPVTSVTYNIVAGPNAGMNSLAKQAPVKKEALQDLRKGPAAGPSGPKKNMPPNKPVAAMNKPPLSGRPNPRFQGKPVDNAPNNFMSNPQPMKLGFQNAGGNFGPSYGQSVHESNNAGGNYGSYRPGNFGNMRNDLNPSSDMRNDFRSNMRDDYRSDTRDMRDIRDVRTVDMSVDNRAETTFRAGFYRDVPVESGRDGRDFGGNYRAGDISVDVRSDGRSGIGADTRDMRSMLRNEVSRDIGMDIRGYSNNDLRDVRSDSRGEYIRDRNALSGYGASAGFGQTYRGNDDYRSDNYGRSGQSSGSVTTAGNFSSGMMASGRYDNYMDRNTSAYSNQYSGSSRGMGYMGDMSLNGR